MKHFWLQLSAIAAPIITEDYIGQIEWCPYTYSINSIVIAKTLRAEEFTEQFGETFKRKYFTALEAQMSESSANLMQYFASRIAAKIAIFRILNLGANTHFSWHDIEIQKLPGGEPAVILYSGCQELAKDQEIEKWLLSISHTPRYAAASAIAQYRH